MAEVLNGNLRLRWLSLTDMGSDHIASWQLKTQSILYQTVFFHKFNSVVVGVAKIRMVRTAVHFRELDRMCD